MAEERTKYQLNHDMIDAIRDRDPNALEDALKAGANPNVRGLSTHAFFGDKEHDTPRDRFLIMHSYKHKGENLSPLEFSTDGSYKLPPPRIPELLLEYGAELTPKPGGENILSEDKLTGAIAIQHAKNEKLIKAAGEGAINDIKEALRDGAHLEGRSNGHTALFAAAHAGHGEAVKLLLDEGADMYAASLDKDSELYSRKYTLDLAGVMNNPTAEEGIKEIFRGQRDRDNAVSSAVIKGTADDLRTALDAGGSPNTLSIANSGGRIDSQRLRHMAIDTLTSAMLSKTGDIEEKIDILLNAGADPNGSRISLVKNPVVDLATYPRERLDENAKIRILKKLAEKGADLEAGQPRVGMDYLNLEELAKNRSMPKLANAIRELKGTPELALAAEGKTQETPSQQQQARDERPSGRANTETIDVAFQQRGPRQQG